MLSTPTVRYVHPEPGVDVAYWSLGRGPALLWVPNLQLSHLGAEWSIPSMRAVYEELARSRTLVRLDPRGGGLSSRGRRDLSIDAYTTDIEAVADALGLEHFALFGALAGGLPAVACAARNPERVTHLVLWSSFARDAVHGMAPRMRSLFTMAATDWQLFSESISQAALGWQDADEARLWADAVRRASSQEDFLAYAEARRGWDVTDRLPAIRASTLVLFDERNALASEERSRELAAGIAGARLVVADSIGGMPGPVSLATLRGFLQDAPPSPGRLEGLTAREQEILTLVAQGASNPEIAERLCISIHTVTRHLTHIYAKIGVRGRAQAMRLALDRGFA